MITPQEIRQKAARSYLALLRAGVRGEPFFPFEIRFRKARAGDDYLALRQWVGELLAGSKAERGYGYTVILEERNLQRYGRQTLPARITIDSAADFLRLIGKEAEYGAWQTAVARTREAFPQLQAWLARYPQRVLPHLAVWDDLLRVCRYFSDHPTPGLYIRELPIPVHSKFIEEHQGILRHLLDDLLPAAAIREDETEFTRRFGLRADEPQIRLRLLDPALPEKLRWPAADLSVPLTDCAQLDGLGGRVVFIVENKMTFLTLPPAADGVAIWGQGFQVNRLRDISWLAGCAIWYWGDLDAAGFAILSQLRGYWSQTRSFLMDGETLARYQAFIVPGNGESGAALENLTEGETAVYRQLIAANARLEQERIRQADVVAAVKGILADMETA